ncbi:hypothetical protein CAEBREN_06122 [Caenorhabditis brenneri]|uniref:Uncharacterized protein n=1 Tax=Caenorhabditis brenneri TaxID=135651 RepID=G0N5U4_CAEBE|nr:hypothetical protein CAEBREN_06122 [Caenorhabditis brenneri]
MKCRLLAFLLLIPVILQSLPATATPDSPGSKTFSFQFYYPGTNMMTLDDVVSLAESALFQNMTVMMKMVSTDAPISFTIKNCNKVILESDIPTGNLEIYFDVIWMTYLVESGKRRCSREEYDFTLQIKASEATSGIFRFVFSEPIATMDSREFDGGIRVHQTKWEQRKYPTNLQDQISQALISSTTKSLVILPDFEANKFTIQFRKCGLNQKMLSLSGTSPVVLDTEMLFHLELLSHLKCKEDSHDGSLLLILFGFILTVCIAIGHCFAWCEEGQKARYIKKNPLLMRPLPPIPEQDEIEMTVFVPKFITLSYDSRDYSEGSTEHIYESID